MGKVLIAIVEAFDACGITSVSFVNSIYGFNKIVCFQLGTVCQRFGVKVLAFKN